MTNPPEEDLRRRERDLEARELNIRLRELESEILDVSTTRPAAEPSVPSDPTPTQSSKRTLKRWGWNLIKLGKFLGFVIVVAVAIRVASWLASAIIVGAIALVAYQLFFREDKSR